MNLRLRLTLAAAALTLLTASAQTLVQVPVPLLGPHMGTATRAGDATTTEDPMQADAPQAAALKEDGFQRFASATYGSTHVQAFQFNDTSGATSAFSLFLRDNAARTPKITAADTAIVDGRTLVLAQSVVLLADKGADAATLAAITSALPKIGGPRSQAPLLPTFFPTRGLVPHSLRYALGPATYAAAGGTLPAAQLGWEKSAEAAFAQYADKRGKETLTLLLYPTPQIAGEHTRLLEQQFAASGGKVRREGELVLLAQGSFSAADAQALVDNVHLRSEVSFDKPLPPSFPTEIRKTYSLLSSVAILAGFGMLAAVLLGLFFGGGRAALRVMRGKDAAAEVEFLSLHLDPQNKAPKLTENPSPASQNPPD